MRTLMVVVCLALTVSALAQMPAPDPKLKELQPFAGRWSCTGENFPSPFGPAHTFNAAVAAHWTLDNYWMQVEFREAKTTAMPMPFTAIIYITWDAGQKAFALGSVDSTGAYETALGSGWSGDVLTFEGPLHGGGMTMTARDTFTRGGTTKMTHVFTVKQPDGSWMKVEEDHCTRK
jgi:hypothetical protein